MSKKGGDKEVALSSRYNSFPRGVVLGYHGTNEQAAPVILRDGFAPSRNEYDWLGDGAYFFQDAPMRASLWAKELHGEAAVVLECWISLEDCMDLLDVTWNPELGEAYDRFLSNLKENRLPLPQQKGKAHRLDRHVINYLIGFLADQGTIIRSVRSAFIEGRPVYKDSAIFDESHVQIAARDMSVIRDISLV